MAASSECRRSAGSLGSMARLLLCVTRHWVKAKNKIRRNQRIDREVGAPSSKSLFDTGLPHDVVEQPGELVADDEGGGGILYTFVRLQI